MKQGKLILVIRVSYVLVIHIVSFLKMANARNAIPTYQNVTAQTY